MRAPTTKGKTWALAWYICLIFPAILAAILSRTLSVLRAKCIQKLTIHTVCTRVNHLFCYSRVDGILFLKNGLVLTVLSISFFKNPFISNFHDYESDTFLVSCVNAPYEAFFYVHWFFFQNSFFSLSYQLVSSHWPFHSAHSLASTPGCSLTTHVRTYILIACTLLTLSKNFRHLFAVRIGQSHYS